MKLFTITRFWFLALFISAGSLVKYDQETLSINIIKLPVCTTEQGIEIIKSNIKKLRDWKNIFELVPKNFKKNTELKRSGLAGLFSASLELSKNGVLSIMQNKAFDKLLIKEKKL